MKLFKRKPKKLIQARFIYDSSQISTYGQKHSEWQVVTEKQYQSAINTLDGWSSNQFITLGNLTKSRYDIKGFEKREIK